MKRLVASLFVLIIGLALVYGGFSYRAYGELQEQVYTSWKSKNYIEARAHMNEFEKSLSYKALSLVPRYRDELLYRKAWVESALGNYESATKQFLALGDSPHVGVDASFAAGVLSLNPQDLTISIDLFWKALAKNGEHFKARTDLELLLVEKKKQDEGREKMEKEGDKDQDADADSDKEGKKKKDGKGRAGVGNQYKFKDMPQNQSGQNSEGKLQY